MSLKGVAENMLGFFDSQGVEINAVPLKGLPVIPRVGDLVALPAVGGRPLHVESVTHVYAAVGGDKSEEAKLVKI